MTHQPKELYKLCVDTFCATYDSLYELGEILKLQNITPGVWKVLTNNYSPCDHLEVNQFSTCPNQLAKVEETLRYFPFIRFLSVIRTAETKNDSRCLDDTSCLIVNCLHLRNLKLTGWTFNDNTNLSSLGMNIRETLTTLQFYNCEVDELQVLDCVHLRNVKYTHCVKLTGKTNLSTAVLRIEYHSCKFAARNVHNLIGSPSRSRQLYQGMNELGTYILSRVPLAIELDLLRELENEIIPIKVKQLYPKSD